MAAVPGWKSVGGKSRRYVNEATGESLSRRQYDKLYGALHAQGFASYESKAKTNADLAPDLSKARPARGRHSALPKSNSKIAEKIRRHKKTTKNGKVYGDILIDVSYSSFYDTMKSIAAMRTARMVSIKVMGVSEKTGESIFFASTPYAYKPKTDFEIAGMYEDLMTLADGYDFVLSEFVVRVLF